MCGIVGLISRRSNGFFSIDMEMLENLLVLDTLRGMDSTGAFCIAAGKQVMAVKHASHPLHTFRSNEWNKFRQKVINSGRIVVGHNRKATQGAVNSENAHPFIENNIILVHNGTLRGHKELADKDVDSHAVCHAFSERGVDAVLPTIDGAFAFVWWDTKKERLFAVRNDERPLSIVVTEEAYAIASEPWMPTVLFSRSGKKVTETIMIDPGVLYSFTLKGEMTSEKVELKPKTVVETSQYRYPYMNECGDDDCTEMGGWGGRSGPPFRAGSVSPINQQAILEEARARAGVHPALLRSHGSTGSGNFSRGTPIDDKDFKKGDKVLIVLNRFQSDADARVKAFGNVTHPGKPPYDIVCFLPPNADIAEADEWQGKPVIATVSQVLESTCGKSIWMHTPYLDTIIRTNNDPVSVMEWKHICDHVRCTGCEAKIAEDEASFTTVTKHTGGRYRVTCPDCVADKLPEGEMKNEFIKRRNAAVQNGQPERSKIILLPNGKAGTESSPSVH